MITTQREGKTVVLSRPARKEIEGDSDFQGGRGSDGEEGDANAWSLHGQTFSDARLKITESNFQE